jgi:hypothetical protein
VQLLCRHDVIAERGNKWRQQLTGCTYPPGEGGADQIDAFTREDLRLAIERQVVTILRHQHMCQERRTSQSTLDRP